MPWIARVRFFELLEPNPPYRQMNKPLVGVNLWNAAGIVAPGPEGRPLVAGCESLMLAYINQTLASVLSDYIVV